MCIVYECEIRILQLIFVLMALAQFNDFLLKEKESRHLKIVQKQTFLNSFKYRFWKIEPIQPRKKCKNIRNILIVVQFKANQNHFSL